MATQTVSTLSAVLKQFYAPSINRALNNRAVIWNRLKKVTDKHTIAGNSLLVNIPLQTKRRYGRGAIAEGGTLPSAGAGVYSNMQASLAYIYGVFNVSRQALKATSNLRGKYSFIEGLNEDMKDITDGMVQDINRYGWGAGDGLLGKISTASGSVTAGTGIAASNIFRFERGMRIDSYDARTSGSIGINSATIDDVDYNAGTFTLTATTTIKQNDYVYPEDSYGNAPMGLEGIVDDGTVLATFQGIARSGNTAVQGNTLGNGGSNRSITAVLVQNAYERGEQVVDRRPTCIVSGYGVRRAWFDLLEDSKRYVGGLKLDGGFSSLEYSGGAAPIPWFTDRMVPANQAYFLHEPELAIFNATNGIEWVDEDGAVLSRASDDSFDARATCYFTLGCYNPQGNTVLQDLTEG